MAAVDAAAADEDDDAAGDDADVAAPARAPADWDAAESVSWLDNPHAKPLVALSDDVENVHQEQQ